MTWLAIARRYLGVREIPGPKADPTILGFARRMGGWVASWYQTDATPWCALYANAVLQEAGLPMSAKPGSADLLRAKSFLTYGTVLAEPALGCLLVFDRAGGGHVGFYTGETLKAFRVLGGNTSDEVREAWLSKDRICRDGSGEVIGYRWPPGVPPPTVGRKFLRPTGESLSKDEA
jgi:uncharacterized protein (TIGR02594 family)